MKTSIRACFALAISVIVLCPVHAQVGLSFVSAHIITPNAADTIGAFARIYYNASQQKFYVLYSARQVGSKEPAGRLSKFAWREYDQSMSFAGRAGYLPGYTSAGDYAMVLADTTYYHLTPDGYNYKLT